MCDPLLRQRALAYEFLLHICVSGQSDTNQLLHVSGAGGGAG